jgi:hypothetical protein
VYHSEEDQKAMNRYVSNKNKRYVGLLLIFLLIIGYPITNLKAASLSSCKRLDTVYPYLASDWQWLSVDKVAFNVTQGLPSGGIYVNHTQWYQYDLANDKLDKLTSTPLQTANISSATLAKLKDLVPGKNGMSQGIHSSKSGTKLVYPRKTQDRAVYWFIDLETGVEANLGLVAGSDVAANKPDVFWFPDEKQFIISSVNSYTDHILWVAENGQKIDIKRLADTPPLSDYGPGFADSAFRVVGLNPTGGYLLILPESQDPIIWLDDLANKKITPLKIELRYDPFAIWTSNTTFEAVTKQGVIEYDVQSQSVKVLATLEGINLDNTGSTTRLSPDGKFLVTAHSGVNGTNTGAGIEVCALR